MTRVMIVDDEILVRMGIRSITDWEQNGYSVVCEAGNSREAIEKIPLYRPQVVLTDLMMDGMDGFDLIDYCVQHHPEIRMIVLSSYNDFEYVRRAMKMGAADYIFKLTVKEDELLKVLGEARAHPHKSAVQPGSIIQKNLSAIKTRLITTGIQQSYRAADEYLAEFAELGLDTDFTKPFVILYISVDDFVREQRRDGTAQIQLLKTSMENLIQEVHIARHLGETYNYSNGDLLVVHHPREAGVSSRVGEAFHTIAEYMRRYLGISVSGALSDTYVGLDMLPAAVSQAAAILAQRFFHAKGRLYLSHCDIAPKEAVHEPEPSPRDLADALLAGNFRLVKSDLAAMAANWKAQADATVHSVRQSLLACYMSMVSYGKENDIAVDSLQDQAGFSLYDAIVHYDYLDSICESFTEILTHLEQAFTQRSVRPEILEAKRYVRSHLAEELTVESVARHVNMSKSYFSHLFKKETDGSFIDYVNQMRISRAQELLVSSNLRVAEVGEQIGINNSNYFGTLFKKMTGCSPSEYKASVHDAHFQ